MGKAWKGTPSLPSKIVSYVVVVAFWEKFLMYFKVSLTDYFQDMF